MKTINIHKQVNVDVLNVGNTKTCQLNNVSMSNTEYCYDNENCGTVMENTELINDNCTDASRNTNDDMATNNKVTYNILNAQVRILLETVQDSQVHSKMVMNFVGE